MRVNFAFALVRGNFSSALASIDTTQCYKFINFVWQKRKSPDIRDFADKLLIKGKDLKWVMMNILLRGFSPDFLAENEENSV